MRQPGGCLRAAVLAVILSVSGCSGDSDAKVDLAPLGELCPEGHHFRGWDVDSDTAICDAVSAAL